jgi:hypothetical protein
LSIAGGGRGPGHNISNIMYVPSLKAFRQNWHPFPDSKIQ